jgi:cob(I)alamin adenosyltransferase
MSISTKRGDAGQTGLAGGIRVSKSCARVEAYGTVDELNASLGLARSICEDANLKTATAAIQRELFRVGSALATPAESPKPQVPVTREMVDALTDQVHQIDQSKACSPTGLSLASTPRPQPMTWLGRFAAVRSATSCALSKPAKLSSQMSWRT